MTKSPRIWAMWHSGRADAPDGVRRCFDLWERLNPEATLHVVEGEEVRRRLGAYGIDPANNRPNINANLVRLDLLVREGGVWVDATLVPTRSLAEWFTGRYDVAGFFAPAWPQPGHLIDNWFLASAPGNVVCVRWLEIMAEIFQQPKRLLNGYLGPRSIRPLLKYKSDRDWFVRPGPGRHGQFMPYYAMHYAFNHMVETDPEVAAVWQAMPKFPAFLMLASERARNFADHPDFDEALMPIIAAAPIHKINRRIAAHQRVIDLAERFVAEGGAAGR